MSFKDYLNTYEFESILPGSGEKLKFKPLTTKEMKKLLTYEGSEDYESVEKMLDMIIENAVIDEDFNIDNLYLQDRFYLLVDIRKKSKGENYEFEYDCPDCGSQNYISFSLDDLKVDYLSNDIDNKVDLTNEVSVYVWFVTRGEEKEALENTENHEKQNRKEAESQLNILTQGIKAVETPEGKEENLSFEDKKYIVDNLTIKNLTNIREWYENNNFGVDFRIKRTCKQCGKEEEASIPLVDFFS